MAGKVEVRTGVLCDYKVAAEGAGNILIARFRSPARHRPHTPTQSVYRGVRDTKSVYPCCVMFSVCAVTCNVVISPSVSPDSLYKWSGDKKAAAWQPAEQPPTHRRYLDTANWGPGHCYPVTQQLASLPAWLSGLGV